jgi:predicted permease
MDKLISVISTALPVFLALFIGMLCRSKNFLTRDGVDTLKKVVINLTLPFVLFNSFATAEYTLSSLILPIIIFLVCCIMLALGFLGATYLLTPLNVLLYQLVWMIPGLLATNWTKIV